MEGKFECPSCEMRIAVDSQMSGEEAECPHCNSLIVIPRTFLSAGTVLGSFQIERLLGSGGMGDVYLATQTTMQRAVALKVLPEAMTQDKESLDEFLHEVRMTAKLDHPNIVTAFEAGDEDGLYFLATTFVDGSDLEQIVRDEGPFAENDALEIIEKIAMALSYAWEREQILHQDIKPANIMLDRMNEVKLLDLGIAKSQLEQHLEQAEGANLVMGTPDYMSPEQVQGNALLDFRTDMYSLGATLYHLVTGAPPFSGSTPHDVMRCHLEKQPVQAHDRNPKVSEQCSKLIGRLMAKSRDDRYPSWLEMIQTVQVLLGKSSIKIDVPADAKKPAPKSKSAKRGGGGGRKTTTGRPKSKRRKSRKTQARVPVVVAKKQSPAVFIAVGIAVVVVLVIIVSSSSSPAPPPRRPPPKAVASNPNQLESRYRELQRDSKRPTADMKTMLGRWEAFALRAKGTNYAALAQREVNRLKPLLVMKQLKARAQALARNNRYEEAIQVYTQYKGEYAYQLKAEREREAIEMRERLDRLESHTRERFSEKIEQLTHDLFALKLGSARFGLNAIKNEFKGTPLSKKQQDVLDRIEKVCELDNIIMSSFERQVGKDVTVALNRGKTKLRVGSVANGRVTARGQGGTLHIDIEDLSVQEKLKRLGKSSAPENFIMRGLLAVSVKKYGIAKELFAQSASPLGLMLEEIVEDRVPEIDEDEAAAAMEEILKTFSLSKDVFRNDPERAAAKVRKRSRAFRSAIKAYSTRYENTTVGQTFVGLAEDILEHLGGGDDGASTGNDANYTEELARLNPDFDPDRDVLETEADIDGRPVKLRLRVTKLEDASPLRDLRSLVELHLVGGESDRPGRRGRLADISFARGLKNLSHFECTNTRVTDVSPLSQLPLEVLILRGSAVNDIRPLRTRELVKLDLSRTKVSNVSALKGMPLTWLDVSHCQMKNDLPDGLPLVYLNAAHSGIKSIKMLHRSPIEQLDITGCPIHHLSSLRNSPIERLVASGSSVRKLDDLEDTSITYLDVSDTKVKELKPLSNTPIQNLNIDDTDVDDVEPLSFTTSLQELRFNGFDAERDKMYLSRIFTLTTINGRPFRHRGGRKRKARE